jgi:hypothetical protein
MRSESAEGEGGARMGRAHLSRDGLFRLFEGGDGIIAAVAQRSKRLISNVNATDRKRSPNVTSDDRETLAPLGQDGQR